MLYELLEEKDGELRKMSALNHDLETDLADAQVTIEEQQNQLVISHQEAARNKNNAAALKVRYPISLHLQVESGSRVYGSDTRDLSTVVPGPGNVDTDIHRWTLVHGTTLSLRISM